MYALRAADGANVWQTGVHSGLFDLPLVFGPMMPGR